MESTRNSIDGVLPPARRTIPRRFDLGPSTAISSATRLPAPTFQRPFKFTFRRGLSARSVKSQRWTCVMRPEAENVQSPGASAMAVALFALDARAKSATAIAEAPGDWTFSASGRITQVHRWDLTERADNPRLNVNLKGRWNVGAGSLVAEEIAVEGPRSNLRGMVRLAGGSTPSMELRVDSMGIQASDLLACYRAFHPDVVEGVTVEQYFTGGMNLRGWPLALQSAALSSSGGVVKVPGFAEPVRIGPLSGGSERGLLALGPVRVALGGEIRDVLAPKRRRVALAMENAADLTFVHDLNTQAGSISVEGNFFEVEDFLKLSAAFGHQLNHGWELNGQATAVTKWEWKSPSAGRWNGRIVFNNANLTVAGLNQPLKISESALDWIDGRRIARVMRVEGFGGTWTGNIEERAQTDVEDWPEW